MTTTTDHRSPGEVHPRAPRHTHDAAQRAVLKACPICMNVAAHDAQCKAVASEGCRVSSCWLNQLGDYLDRPHHHPETDFAHLPHLCAALGCTFGALRPARVREHLIQIEATDADAIEIARKTPGVPVYSEESGDYFEIRDAVHGDSLWQTHSGARGAR